VAHVVQLRFAPELRFYRDETMDAMEQIQKLVEQTKQHDRLRDGNESS
jgi:ribosome-binding factor A